MSDILMEVPWVGVLVATTSSFLFSGVWYGVLLKSAWMSGSGVTEEQVNSGDPKRIFGVSIVLQFIAALGLAMFIGSDATLLFGLLAGFSVGFFWVATALGITYLFERRPLLHWAVNAGNQVVVFTLMGTILGAWP